MAYFLVPDAILFNFGPFLRISTRVWPTDGRTDGRSDGRTDGWTDRRTDGRTDTPSYRDARTHLKRFWKMANKNKEIRWGRWETETKCQRSARESRDGLTRHQEERGLNVRITKWRRLFFILIFSFIMSFYSLHATTAGRIVDETFEKLNDISI